MDEVNPRAALLRIVDSPENGMVQNQVTIVWLDLSPMGSEGFPPSDAIGGGPKKRGHQAPWGIATPLRQLRQLAERVEFPEKNATVCQFRASFGGRGRIPQEKCGFRGPMWIASRG